MHTRNEIVNIIKQIADKDGNNWMTFKEFIKRSGISRKTFFKTFEKWNDAVREAGLQPLDEKGRPDSKKGYSKEDLINKAKKIKEKLKAVYISQIDFLKEAGISERPINRLFGNWENFIKEVGFELHPMHKKKIPDEKFYQEYFRVKDLLGRLPKYQELARESTYSIGAYENRFGNFTEFKKCAIQYGIHNNLIKPMIGEKEMAKLRTKEKDTIPFYKALNDRPVLGENINFHGLLHAPVNEIGVVYLFGTLSEELGFFVESIQAGFPDCEAKRKLKNNQWQRVRIEFEFRSSHFIDHQHNISGCDIIVCWEHNWHDCPLEVIALKEYIKKKG